MLRWAARLGKEPCGCSGLFLRTGADEAFDRGVDFVMPPEQRAQRLDRIDFFSKVGTDDGLPPPPLDALKRLAWPALI